jgi:hypothetical protein
MAEIKSTLDIIMEKTRHLVLSPEEKQQLELDEHLRKIQGYPQKYLDDGWHLDHLLEEIASLPDQYRALTTQELTKRLVTEVSFDAKGHKCLQALEQLADDEHRSKVTALRRLIERYDASQRKLLSSQTKDLTTQLAALGISGNAVVARGENNFEWETRSLEHESQLHELQASW